MTSLPPSAGEQSTPGLDQDIFHYKGDVRYNNLLATLDTWGPLFRYSLDLKINSEKKSHGNANILLFKGATGTNEQYGNRIDAIYWNNLEDKLTFVFSISGDGGYSFYSAVLSLDTWYNVEISQWET